MKVIPMFDSGYTSPFPKEYVDYQVSTQIWTKRNARICTQAVNLQNGTT